MKLKFLMFFGAIGGFIAPLFGGWTTTLTTLIIFMAIDYVTGLIVAGVFHKSPKTETGSLESKTGWKGLFRKGTTMFIVLVACRLDMLIGTNFIKESVIIAYITNELISIVENMGLMGVPIPSVIAKAIDVLKKKEDNTSVELNKTE